MAVSTASPERLLAAREVLAGLASLAGGDLSALAPEALPLELLQRLARTCRAPLAGLLRLEADGRLVPWAAFCDDRLDARPSDQVTAAFARQLVGEARPRQQDLGAGAPANAAATIKVLVGAPLKADGRVLGAAYVGLARRLRLRPAQLDRFALLVDRLALSLELERLVLERRAAERLKSDFLAMVSHELRTPLTGILGYTDLLLRQSHGLLNDQQLVYQHAVRSSAERLLSLVGDLLEVARLQGHGCPVDIEPVAVVGALRQAMAVVAAEARLKGVHLRLDDACPPLFCLADRGRLQQILRHLLSNAVKFTPAGGQVRLGAAQLGRDEVCLSVKDSGAGLAPDQAERVWDCFYQADSSAARAAGGAGLGLSIVKSLATLLGGRVWVESDGPQLGSTFFLALPLAPAGQHSRDDIATGVAAK